MNMNMNMNRWSGRITVRLSIGMSGAASCGEFSSIVFTLRLVYMFRVMSSSTVANVSLTVVG